MRAVERRRLCALVGLVAVSGIAGCAQTSSVVANESQPPIWSTRHRTDASAAKAHIAGSATERLEVVGLDQAQIRSRLGTPVEDVQNFPAKQAVFSDGRCRLSVTLYPDVQTRVYRALAYKVIGNADTVEERRRCSAVFAARLQRKPVVDRPAHTGDPG